jgi:hypothetical protein
MGFGVVIKLVGTFDAAGLAAGPYTVTYTFTDMNGCTNSADAITVNALQL